MNNTYNLKLYGFYAPRYERLFGWLAGRWFACRGG